jgi:ATP-binding cassette, subfamily F, member 3
VDKGTVRVFDGDLDEYADMVLSKRRVPEPAKLQVTKPAPERRMARPAKQVHKQIQELDAKMLKTQDKISVLEAALADPKIYAQEPAKAADYARLRNKLAEDLAADEDRWLELNGELENA